MQMTEEEFRHFVDTVAAAAFATKAMMACHLAGIAVSREACARIYGQWINPQTPHFERLVEMIDRHVAEALEPARAVHRGTAGSA